MEQFTGDRILRAVREHYSSGFKSSNKIYVLDESQQNDEKLAKKAQLRRKNAEKSLNKAREVKGSLVRSYEATSGNCAPMALRSAGEAINAGSSAHIGWISSPGDHAFCVVDYTPHVGGPKHVGDMFKDDCARAWVIDAWMNISCPFEEYPARAKSRLLDWSRQGKHIIFGSEEPKPYDPINPAYIDGFFFSGPLRFDKVVLVPFKHPVTGDKVMAPLLI